MRRTLSVLMLLMMFSVIAVPAQAALTLDTAFIENGANRVVSMIMVMPEENGNDEQMEAMMNANMLIQTRFPLAQYMMSMKWENWVKSVPPSRSAVPCQLPGL